MISCLYFCFVCAVNSAICQLLASFKEQDKTFILPGLLIKLFVKANIKAAQVQTNSYAYNKQRDLQLNIEDEMLLKVS